MAPPNQYAKGTFGGDEELSCYCHKELFMSHMAMSRALQPRVDSPSNTTAAIPGAATSAKQYVHTQHYFFHELQYKYCSHPLQCLMPCVSWVAMDRIRQCARHCVEAYLDAEGKTETAIGLSNDDIECQVDRLLRKVTKLVDFLESLIIIPSAYEEVESPREPQERWKKLVREQWSIKDDGTNRAGQVAGDAFAEMVNSQIPADRHIPLDDIRSCMSIIEFLYAELRRAITEVKAAKLSTTVTTLPAKITDMALLDSKLEHEDDPREHRDKLANWRRARDFEGRGMLDGASKLAKVHRKLVDMGVEPFGGEKSHCSHSVENDTVRLVASHVPLFAWWTELLRRSLSKRDSPLDLEETAFRIIPAGSPRLHPSSCVADGQPGRLVGNQDGRGGLRVLGQGGGGVASVGPAASSSLVGAASVGRAEEMSMLTESGDTEAGDMVLAIPALGPDVERVDGQVGAQDSVGTQHLGGASLEAVRAGSAPVAESQVVVPHAITIHDGHAAPRTIQIKRVGVRVAPWKSANVQSVRLPDPPLLLIMSICEPMAQPPDRLQKMLSTRMFEAGDLTVAHSSLLLTSTSWIQMLVPPDVDAIEAAFVAAADEHVVHLAVRAGVHAEVELGAVGEHDVVDGEFGDLVEAEDARVVFALCSP
ncbi:pectin lyase fold/virulence factor [Zalerion maritima]|uniref:Pectin lyase fold/virulence factor n=1 Tax=Zalerion maritima TaxID=339359 RepID=A0AAD5RSZ4_9PEZI|nr:pectin lyase fold/virulence factor [Zalerion maritima]